MRERIRLGPPASSALLEKVRLMPGVTSNNRHHLIEVGVPFASPDTVSHAMGEVVTQQEVSDLVEGGTGRADLNQDLWAVPLFLNHP